MSQTNGKQQIVNKAEIMVVIQKFWLILQLLLSNLSKEFNTPIILDVIGHIKAIYLANWILQFTIIGKCYHNHTIVVIDKWKSNWFVLRNYKNDKPSCSMRLCNSYHIRCGCPSIQLPCGTYYECDEGKGGQALSTTFHTSLYANYIGKK